MPARGYRKYTVTPEDVVKMPRLGRCAPPEDRDRVHDTIQGVGQSLSLWKTSTSAVSRRSGDLGRSERRLKPCLMAASSGTAISRMSPYAKIREELRLRLQFLSTRRGQPRYGRSRPLVNVNRAFSGITGYARETNGSTPHLLESDRYDMSSISRLAGLCVRSRLLHGELWCRRQKRHQFARC